MHYLHHFRAVACRGEGREAPPDRPGVPQLQDFRLVLALSTSQSAQCELLAIPFPRILLPLTQFLARQGAFGPPKFPERWQKGGRKVLAPPFLDKGGVWTFPLACFLGSPDESLGAFWTPSNL